MKLNCISQFKWWMPLQQSRALGSHSSAVQCHSNSEAEFWPHSALWSWEQQHRLSIQKVWKLPWAMSGMPCTNYKLLFKRVSLVGQWHPHHHRIVVTYGYSLQSGRYGQVCSCKRRNTELLASSAKIIRGLEVNWLCRKGWLRKTISFKQTCVDKPLLNTFHQGTEDSYPVHVDHRDKSYGNARTLWGQRSQEKGRTALRHQHTALPEFAPAEFLLGVNILF